jgi:hypothetical protein
MQQQMLGLQEQLNKRQAPVAPPPPPPAAPRLRRPPVAAPEPAPVYEDDEEEIIDRQPLDDVDSVDGAVGYDAEPEVATAPPPSPSRRPRGQQPHRPAPKIGDIVQSHVAQPAAAAPSSAPLTASDLQIAFLTPKPAKPTKQVTFNLGPGGTLRKRYHDVQRSAGCVVLVYDTRYEDGEQWVPPADPKRGVPLAVTLPKASADAPAGETVPVLSFGQQFNVGCLDFVILAEVTADGGDEEGTVGVGETGFVAPPEMRQHESLLGPSASGRNVNGPPFGVSD